MFKVCLKEYRSSLLKFIFFLLMETLFFCICHSEKKKKRIVVNVSKLIPDEDPNAFGSPFGIKINREMDQAISKLSKLGASVHYRDYLNSIWLSGVPQGSVLVYFLSYVIVGKTF